MIYTYVGSSTMNELENDFAQNSVKLTLTSSIDKKETSNWTFCLLYNLGLLGTWYLGN